MLEDSCTRASRSPLVIRLIVLFTIVRIPWCTTAFSSPKLESGAIADDGVSSRSISSMDISPVSYRYRARVAYDGSNFQGFQIQHRQEEITSISRQTAFSTSKEKTFGKGKAVKRQQRTVQGVLESVLSQRLDEDMRVLGAGRTDSGVHARGQAIHFDCRKNLTAAAAGDSCTSLQDIEKSINAMLPSDVCLFNFQAAPPERIKTIDGRHVTKKWSVMHDSTKKLYSYRLNVAPVMDPLLRHDRWHPDLVHVWLPYVKRLECVLQHYVGTHDFRAFAGGMDRKESIMMAASNTIITSDGNSPDGGGRENSLNSVRTVYAVELVSEDVIDNTSVSGWTGGGGGGGGNYRIDFWISGGMYKQIRNMVGAALEVCRGKIMKEDDVRRLLYYNSNNDDDENGRRRWSRKDNPAKPAPPHGLTLEHVYFDDEDF
jgi:tRNA pseudouridine38-40 synthase